MGKKSRLKKEIREKEYGVNSKKLMKQLKRESAPDAFVCVGFRGQ